MSYRKGLGDTWPPPAMPSAEVLAPPSDTQLTAAKLFGLPAVALGKLKPDIFGNDLGAIAPMLVFSGAFWIGLGIVIFSQLGGRSR